jgi:y4mF family transcriptional regulator
MNTIAQFVKERRKKIGLTQSDLAQKSGVGLRFVRELERGKETLRLDKVNQLLALFGHELAAVKSVANTE